MHHLVVALQYRLDIGTMERQVEDVAVIAPIGPENHEHSLVLLRSVLQRLLDLGVGIDPGRIEILLGRRRLLQPRWIGSFGHYKPPPLALLLPKLSLRDEHRPVP